MMKKLLLRISVIALNVIVGVVFFVYSENQSEQLLENIIEKSDCCVCLSSIGGATMSFDSDIEITDDLKFMETKDAIETSVEEIIGLGDEEIYFPNYEVTLAKQYEDGKPIIEYADDYVCEKNSDIRPLYILFLSKSDEGDYYYITGGKSGAIELKIGGMNPLDKRLMLGVLFKFKSDIKVFREWYENEYEFSEKMVPVKKVVTYYQ